jgi:hypothetical protein
MWDIASHHVRAAAAANDKMVKADRGAAEKQGEKQLPFQYTWPGKPLEDAFSHGFFLNLPVGAVDIPPEPNNSSASLGGQPSALHVQLVLELLLLCWPDPQVPEYTVTSADEEVSNLESVLAESRWDWLLLMSVLLQQMSTEQKQQFLRERGPLLMQLLYQVLLEDKGLGGGGVSDLLTATGDRAWHSWYVAVTNDVTMAQLLSDGWKEWEHSVPVAVAMVLQNLLFESLPESLVDPETARIGKILISPFRKCGTWGGVGGWHLECS